MKRITNLVIALALLLGISGVWRGSGVGADDGTVEQTEVETRPVVLGEWEVPSIAPYCVGCELICSRFDMRNSYVNSDCISWEDKFPVVRETCYHTCPEGTVIWASAGSIPGTGWIESPFWLNTKMWCAKKGTVPQSIALIEKVAVGSFTACFKEDATGHLWGGGFLGVMCSDGSSPIKEVESCEFQVSGSSCPLWTCKGSAYCYQRVPDPPGRCIIEPLESFWEWRPYDESVPCHRDAENLMCWKGTEPWLRITCEHYPEGGLPAKRWHCLYERWCEEEIIRVYLPLVIKGP